MRWTTSVIIIFIIAIIINVITNTIINIIAVTIWLYAEWNGTDCMLNYLAIARSKQWVKWVTNLIIEPLGQNWQRWVFISKYIPASQKKAATHCSKHYLCFMLQMIEKVKPLVLKTCAARICPKLVAASRFLICLVANWYWCEGIFEQALDETSIDRPASRRWWYYQSSTDDYLCHILTAKCGCLYRFRIKKGNALSWATVTLFRL